MVPGIPIATDNIYKFYALIGLAFFIASILGTIYITDSYNNHIYQNYPHLEVLKRKTDLSEEEQITKSILETKMKINRSDKDFFIRGLDIVGGLGIGLMFSVFSPGTKKFSRNKMHY
jgi:hypothetical protein